VRESKPETNGPMMNLGEHQSNDRCTHRFCSVGLRRHHGRNAPQPALRRGAMLVLVAVVMVILLVGAVFSIDVAYMHVVRAELRTATDAAARAGAEALARTQDVALARQAAIDIASMNNVAGKGLTINENDVRFGALNKREAGNLEFVPDQTPVTAVRVDASRSQSSADGAVPLFFARTFSTTQFEPVQHATAAANVRDIALVLDVSGSMAGSRLQALKVAVNDFIDEIQASSPNTRLSLISYSTVANLEIPLTDDFPAIRQRVNAFIAAGFTAIGDGILVGSDSLQSGPTARPFAFKSLIVMTDGHHNTGSSPFSSIQIPISRRQQVHGISFGVGANQNMMRQLAESADGIYLHADAAGDLSQAFRTMARSLSVILTD
jgi:Ca-activated chloride channel homolog